MPKMYAVDSQMFSHIGYDADKQEMHLNYRSGGGLIVEGARPEDVADLAQAPSIGKHWHSFFKNNPRFKVRKKE